MKAGFIVRKQQGQPVRLEHSGKTAQVGDGGRPRLWGTLEMMVNDLELSERDKKPLKGFEKGSGDTVHLHS